MSELHFTNPINLRAYEGWEFEVLPARIVLRTKDVLGVYARDRDRLLNHIKIHGYSFGKVQGKTAQDDAERLKIICGKLEQACKNSRDVHAEDIGEDNGNIRVSCIGLMFERKFVRAYCPSCNREFTSTECEIVEWKFGADLAAEGGHRVCCPSKHTLYSCMEWNS
jgi:hypothetical protein